MPKVYVACEGASSEHCELDRVPTPGEVIELADGSLVQVTGVTHTPHRAEVCAVLSAGKIESAARCRAARGNIEAAVGN